MNPDKKVDFDTEWPKVTAGFNQILSAIETGNGNWGAFQVAARYHALEVDDEAFARGLAAPGASRKAESWTVGLNWYLTGNIRHTLNFERTVFDGDADGPRRAENGIAFRTQLNF